MSLLAAILQRLSKIKGLHYFISRYGSYHVKQLCFDEKFSSGEWNYECKASDELATIVSVKANKGKILMLGCGTAGLCKVLPEESYESILGIDISAMAIENARKHAKQSMTFITADIVNYKYEDNYSIILFSESIYYLKKKEREELLKTCRSHLAEGGVIIVTISNPKRYRNILKEIRNQYQVLEDRNFVKSDRHLIIFR